MGVVEVSIIMVAFSIVAITGLWLRKKRFPDLNKQSRWRYNYTKNLFEMMLAASIVFFTALFLTILYPHSGSDLETMSDAFMIFPEGIIWCALLFSSPNFLKPHESDPKMRRDLLLIFILTLCLSLLFFLCAALF